VRDSQQVRVDLKALDARMNDSPELSSIAISMHLTGVDAGKPRKGRATATA
jgi:hypothetical protein